MKIKDLPQLERPYEKLENYGAEVLSDAELLAIIIKTGTKEKTALEVARKVLELDVSNKGLSFLKDISIQELKNNKGIGKIKAIQIKAVAELASRITKPIKSLGTKITSPKQISDLFMEELKYLSQEVMKTVILNTQNQVIRVITNSIGNLNSNMIEAREIFKEPIKSSAARIVLVHNHPSGDPTPSDSDINFTKRINQASEIIGIELLDHIIIGNEKYCSLKSLKKF
jgi:DNA repair protein RadC